MLLISKSALLMPKKISTTIKKNASKIEIAGGRCAMLGMYQLAFPSQYPIIPLIQIATTCYISLKVPSKKASFSFYNTFEPPNRNNFGYTIEFTREQELINGRVAMLGMTILFMLS